MRSIVTEYENISAFTGNIAECRHQDGLWIPLTHKEHNMASELIYQIHGNPAAEHLSRMLGQLAWEKHQIVDCGYSETEAREAFMRRYGRSYL